MNKKILVVDDDPQIQDLVKFFLDQAGFNVQVSKNGYEALNLLLVTKFDLVILDINMPLMNGFKTLMRIRATPAIRKTPVLMLTANKGRNDVERAKKYHISDYVIKPPNRKDLLQRVERVFGGLPQFEEIQFTKDDPLNNAFISIPFILKSISSNGMILTADVFMKKLSPLYIQELEIFKKLKIEHHNFLVTDCKPTIDGRYEYYISLLNLNPNEQEKIREWVVSETFNRKNA